MLTNDQRIVADPQALAIAPHFVYHHRARQEARRRARAQRLLPRDA